VDTPHTPVDLGCPYAATVTVDPDSATPLYVQVATLLRARIESGEITSRLPSLRTITQEYGVSHITAEKAVQVLREAGEVVTVVGKGTFVRK
jgi:GntR family transcriptional regulator